VRETGKSVASVAKDLGINAGALANWMQMDRLAREQDVDGELSESEREEFGPAVHARRSECCGQT
jgi:transposase